MTVEQAAYLPQEATLLEAQARLSPPQRILADEFCLRRRISYLEACLGEFLAYLAERARERGADAWEDEGEIH